MASINVFAEVKERANLVEIISRLTNTVITGRGKSIHLSECPFCKGHSCFSISAEKQLFNCFQCSGESTGGDVFTFVTRLNGCDKWVALEIVAAEIGYDLPIRKPAGKRNIRDVIMDCAKGNWNLQQARPFMDYLVQTRGLSEELILSHDVGYLLDRDSMISYLKKEGYTYDEIKESGILTKDFGSFYRIVFGCRNTYGSVEGFIGGGTRDQLEQLSLEAKKKHPKYKKNADFHASAPFNLNYAKRYVPSDGTLVIVEGILDCLRIQTMGIKNVVAIAGSALKESFLDSIEQTRYSRVILFLDGDEGGRKGTKRAIEMMLKRKTPLRIYVAELCLDDPDDETRLIKDPDELISKKGIGALQDLILSPVYGGTWLVGAMWTEMDLRSPLTRDSAIKYFGELWDFFQDEVEKKEILKVMAGACDSTQDDLRKSIERWVPERKAVGVHSESDAVIFVQDSKSEELKKKYKEVLEEHKHLKKQYRTVLTGYTKAVKQIGALSKAGRLWHVKRLTEAHMRILKKVRRDPRDAERMFEKVDDIFSSARLNDVDRINREITHFINEDRSKE